MQSSNAKRTRQQVECKVDAVKSSDCWTRFLVILWVSLCMVMAVMDGRMWVVLLSSAAFGALRLFIIPPLSHRLTTSFSKMDTKSQDLWLNTAVSLVHSIILALAVLWVMAPMLSQEDSINWVDGGNFIESIVLAVSTGYFAYDLWDMIETGMYVTSPALILHHAALLVCYVCAIFKNIGLPYLIASLLCEVNSVFLHLRKLQAMHDFQLRKSSTTYAVATPTLWKSSRFYQLTWACLWISMFFTRIAVHLLITVSVYQNQRQFSHQIFYYMAFFGMLIFDLLNVGLLVSVYQTFRKDQRRTNCKKSS